MGHCTLGEANEQISLGLSCFCDVETTVLRSWHDGLVAHARAGGHLGASLPRVAAAHSLPPSGSANHRPRRFTHILAAHCVCAAARMSTFRRRGGKPSPETCGRCRGTLHTCACSADARKKYATLRIVQALRVSVTGRRGGAADPYLQVASLRDEDRDPHPELAVQGQVGVARQLHHTFFRVPPPP